MNSDNTRIVIPTIIVALVVVSFLVIFLGKRTIISSLHEQSPALSYFVDTEEGGVQAVYITDDKTGKELCTAETGKESFDAHQIANILMRYHCQIFKDSVSVDKRGNNYRFLSQENNNYLVVPIAEVGDNRLAKVHIEYEYGSLKHPFDTDKYDLEEFLIAPPGNVFQAASKDGQFFIYATYDGSPYDEHSTSTYSLYDSSGRVLLSNFHQSYDKSAILYDPDNQGFLFIDVTPAIMTDGQYGRRKFTYSYLSLYDTPVFRTLKTYEDEVNVDGKGCGSIEEFHSGFVVLEDCSAPMRVNEKSSSLIIDLPK